MPVTLLWNYQYLPIYHVDSSSIEDLEIVSQQQNAPPTEPYYGSRGSTSEHTAHQQTQDYGRLEKPVLEPFVDPAILSFVKPQIDMRKVSADSHPSQYQQPDTVSPVMIADSIKQSPVSVSRYETNIPPTRIVPPSAATGFPTSRSQKSRDRRDSTATATLTEPFDHMALNEEETNLTVAAVKGATSTRGATRKHRRGASRKAKEPVSQAVPTATNLRDVESVQTTVKKTVAKGRGWRQTPLVEEAPTTSSEVKMKRSRHQSRHTFVEDTNGWATEDATDIQDLGEFDFEHNLSKFDKRRVFDDIRKEDTIADDERLVSLNRQTRPGTNGGRSLHHTENVLSPSNVKTNTWQSEAGETEEDELLEEQYSSGRASRKDGSRRAPPSRKGTLRPGRTSATSSPMINSVPSVHASLRLASTKKPCTCVSPLQMLEIEQLCSSELGLTDEILSENAGRGIAEAVLTLPSSSSSLIRSS